MAVLFGIAFPKLEGHFAFHHELSGLYTHMLTFSCTSWRQAKLIGGKIKKLQDAIAVLEMEHSSLRSQIQEELSKEMETKQKAHEEILEGVRHHLDQASKDAAHFQRLYDEAKKELIYKEKDIKNLNLELDSAKEMYL